VRECREPVRANSNLLQPLLGLYALRSSSPHALCSLSAVGVMAGAASYCGVIELEPSAVLTSSTGALRSDSRFARTHSSALAPCFTQTVNCRALSAVIMLKDATFPHLLL
jgi:hypothetical protein